MGDIQKCVADYFSVDKESICSGRKEKGILRIRRIAIYLCKIKTTVSLFDLGKQFGKKHTTIHHSVNRVKLLMAQDKKLEEDINHISLILDKASGD